MLLAPNGSSIARTLFGWAGPVWAARHRLWMARRPVLLPALSLPARSGLLLLTTSLLGLLWLALAIRGRPLSGDRFEFALLSGQSFSNLNNTSAEALPVSPAPQARVGSPDALGAVPASLESSPAAAPLSRCADSEGPAHAVLRVPERLAAPTPEPVSLPPAKWPSGLAGEDSLPIFPAAVLEPASEDCSPIRDPHQGEPPMMRTWKMLGLNTFVAALLAATPGLGSSTSGPPSDAEKLEEIQKQLNELKNSLADVKKTLADVRTDSSLSAQRVQSQIGEMNNQILQLRADVDSYRNRSPSSTRSSAYPPTDTGPGTGTARIELANTYSQPVSIVINNRRSYPLAPGERRLSDPIPAGSFTYEILGVTPMVTRTVAADKVFTLWVHPQP